MKGGVARNVCGGLDHYMTVQLLLWSLFVLTDNATRAASVKASFTPRFFIAEHSKI